MHFLQHKRAAAEYAPAEVDRPTQRIKSEPKEEPGDRDVASLFLSHAAPGRTSAFAADAMVAAATAAMAAKKRPNEFPAAAAAPSEAALPVSAPSPPPGSLPPAAAAPAAAGVLECLVAGKYKAFADITEDDCVRPGLGLGEGGFWAPARPVR